MGKTIKMVLAVMALMSISALSPADASVAQPKPMKVLVFWGSWCGTCPGVMSQMEQIRKAYAGRNVEFVAVSLEGEAAPSEYLHRKGYGFRSQVNGDELLKRYDGAGVPWVVITDANGKPVSQPSLASRPQAVADLVRIELDLRT